MEFCHAPRAPARRWAIDEDVMICALRICSNRSWSQIKDAFDRELPPRKVKDISSRFTKDLKPGLERPHEHAFIRERLEEWEARNRPECDDPNVSWIFKMALGMLDRADAADARDRAAALANGAGVGTAGNH